MDVMSRSAVGIESRASAACRIDSRWERFKAAFGISVVVFRSAESFLILPFQISTSLRRSIRCTIARASTVEIPIRFAIQAGSERKSLVSISPRKAVCCHPAMAANTSSSNVEILAETAAVGFRFPLRSSDTLPGGRPVASSEGYRSAGERIPLRGSAHDLTAKFPLGVFLTAQFTRQ
jgi:hypothetical protein